MACYNAGSSSLSTVVPFSSIMHAFQSAASCLWSVLHVSHIFKVKFPVFSCKPYSLNWYKFLTTVLFFLLNGMLQCRYFVATLKTIIHDNIICFCLQTLSTEAHISPSASTARTCQSRNAAGLSFFFID